MTDLHHAAPTRQVDGARAAASFAVGAAAIRCWMSGRAANLAAWYNASDEEKDQGPAATGTARGWKLLNAPQGALENRNPQAASFA